MKTINVILLLLVSTLVCRAQNTFPSSGNVGIGTTSPDYNLDIRASQPELRLFETASGGNRRFHLAVGNGEEIRFTSTYGNGGNYPFTFRFGGNLGEVMRITPNGRVGIGVNPGETFHVKGYTKFQRPDGGNFIKIHGNSAGNYLTSDDPGTNQKHLFFQVVSSSLGGKHMYFQTGANSESFQTRMVIRSNGNIGIGTSDPQAKLAVDGNILAKEVKVKTDISVPDYVFEPDYELASLKEVEAYVKEHKHLPEIPSAADIGRDGLNLAKMNLLLLKKVEELTLYLIEKDKDTANLKQLDRRMQKLESLFDIVN